MTSERASTGSDGAPSGAPSDGAAGRLEAGTPVLVGEALVPLPAEIAEQLQPGDGLVGVRATGQILRLPAAERACVRAAVDRAERAFAELASVDDAQITAFYEAFASALEQPEVWAAVREQNDLDVESARERGRSTTRLVADEKLRTKMIQGLREWAQAPSRRGQVLERVQHDGFHVDLVGDALGIVGFVFEGRPNVLADACGVIRGGNSVVFRIGSDALRTARTLMERALTPALTRAGLPDGAAVLIDRPAHAAGWALFCDSRLSLAVARGSGPAVELLGSLARDAGIPVSLHGTGGAWIVASASADAARFRECVTASLDRKVCNTLNTCCIPRSRPDLIPVLLQGLEAAGRRRGQSYKLHVREPDVSAVAAELFTREVRVRRAEGDVLERQAEPLPQSELGHEWEWEETPEVTLACIDSLDQAIEWFNAQSPRFVASLISTDPAEHERFYARIDAPFVGDDHTRWVDGQFALRRPELGLSNWQSGRLFGRGAILTGDSVFTVRARYRREPS